MRRPRCNRPISSPSPPSVGLTPTDRVAPMPRLLVSMQRNPMEYRQLGRTGLNVSAIGFGCWEISGTYGPIDAAEFKRAVGRALDAGINCFDTAEAYGMGISEQAL